MGAKKRKGDRFGTPGNRAIPVPYDGPATRLRNRSSLPPGEPAASLKGVQSAPTQEPVRKQNFEVVILKSAQMQTPVQIRPKKKNTYAQTIIERWPVTEAREAIAQEIALHRCGYQTEDDSSIREKDVVPKMKWANRRLRGGYWAYVQKVPSGHHLESYRKGKSANSDLRGSACEFPTCGAFFQDGQYRISFEPPLHTTLRSFKGAIDLTHDTDRGVEGNTSIAKDHEKPTFFCLKCFDKLLIPYTQGETKAQPVDPFSQKLDENPIFQTPKPGYLRPSPSCRIYDRIRPETRPMPNESFNLSPTEREVIKTWKGYNYNQGLSRLSGKSGFMFSTGLASHQENCAITGLNGIGIAEFLYTHFPENSVPYYSMKKGGPSRAPREPDHK
ncbi:hypothetical protein B9Z19DRAFT_1177065 [Tuber borchii]|uniref:Uncharacterized protein n=1 Tax=Tuber borchii TaxID=42251 RepID=A0A2T6ZUH5_TUBBO|nr:hypothetical protein B9Z19DRAFT_1177065 [Tuber borchii]